MEMYKKSNGAIYKVCTSTMSKMAAVKLRQLVNLESSDCHFIVVETFSMRECLFGKLVFPTIRYK